MTDKEKSLSEAVIKHLSYDPESGKVVWESRRPAIKVGDEAGTITANGYRQITLHWRTLPAHRVAWFLHYGKWPENIIDHINGDTLDNRIKNLRDVTYRRNSQNHKCHRGTKLPGTYYMKDLNKWRALIRIDGKLIHLGLFETEIEAHEVYMKACRV